MTLKAFGAKIFAKAIVRQISSWATNPLETQEKVFNSLLLKGKGTQFGKDHHFDEIVTHADFIARVPIREYEDLRHYVDQMVEGKPDILWPGKPLYFAKTSGTTSGSKYIPITADSMPHHIRAARNAILCYIHETGNTRVVDGKMIFLQGSPLLKEQNGIKLGRLSGIVAHYVPKYLQKNRMPSWETNCMEDWEEKVDAIVEETQNENMTIISGIPSWVQMYFERLYAKTGRKIGALFPNFELFIYGGVNYEPYRKKFESLMGKKVDSIELYPASEGFFAFQNEQKDPGLLLQLDAGIFYEFVVADEFFSHNAKRITLKDVVIGVNYVMIISTNAGLWGYNLGDTIQFTSTQPFKIVVTGRIKHFISAFGEHVIGKEVELAMQKAAERFGFFITEFTVAPQTETPAGELPYHQWLIEFESTPVNLSEIAALIDQSLQTQNSYYSDLIKGRVLQCSKIAPLRKDTFKDYMKLLGKLGGQNKVPRLSNDRKIADELIRLQL